MPSAQVYAVDFKQGNLAPNPDTHGWGQMQLGNSGPATNPTATPDPQGLRLSLDGNGSAASLGPYVVLGQNVLPMSTRLLMRLEFDRPAAEAPAPPATGTPEPWALALLVKAKDETVPPVDPFVAVTCQFRSPGVRLNTPGSLEGDQAAHLLTPLDYSKYHTAVFTLEHHFCGARAGDGYSVGMGTLSVGGSFRGASDQRVYSNPGLSATVVTNQTWIGALGVSLATVNGVGTMSARLRSFSISIW